MPYLKHPHLGSQHASEEDACALELQGWTRFPRSTEAKAAGPWPPIEGAALLAILTPFEKAEINEAVANLAREIEAEVFAMPVKRKPGRPRKV